MFTANSQSYRTCKYSYLYYVQINEILLRHVEIPSSACFINSSSSDLCLDNCFACKILCFCFRTAFKLHSLISCIHKNPSTQCNAPITNKANATYIPVVSNQQIVSCEVKLANAHVRKRHPAKISNNPLPTQDSRKIWSEHFINRAYIIIDN